MCPQPSAPAPTAPSPPGMTGHHIYSKRSQHFLGRYALRSIVPNRWRRVPGWDVRFSPIEDAVDRFVDIPEEDTLVGQLRQPNSLPLEDLI